VDQRLLRLQGAPRGDPRNRLAIDHGRKREDADLLARDLQIGDAIRIRPEPRGCFFRLGDRRVLAGTVDGDLDGRCRRDVDIDRRRERTALLDPLDLRAGFGRELVRRAAVQVPGKEEQH